MFRKSRYTLLFITASTILLVAESYLYSQDLSSIKEQKPLDLSGSIGMTQSLVLRNTYYSSYNPYSLFINGSASFSLYGIAFPFSFSYSNQQVNFSQPFNFNQFGIQPTYKWIKTYLGYNTMSFSPYSLNGHQFLGAGFELTPEKSGIRASMMYGRLIKPVEWDPFKPEIVPYYKRNGVAAKIGYKHSSGTVDVSIFNAQDIINSIEKAPDSVLTAPKDNTVYTFSFRQTVLKKIRITGEYGGSMMTGDLRQDITESEAEEGNSSDKNITRAYSSALKGNIDYTGKSYTVGAAYERVAPDYRTLGAYYMNNDLENISLTFSKSMLQGTLNIAGSGGTQKDNLDKTKLSVSNRFLGNLNVSWTPSERISLSSGFSNFSYFTYMRTPFDRLNTTDPYKNIDTLNFTQVSTSANLNGTFILGSPANENVKKMIMSSMSYQRSASRQGGINGPGDSDFLQGNVAYSWSIIPASLSITTSLLGSFIYMPEVQNQLMIGPVLGANKSFLDKKFSTNTSLAYNLTIRDGETAGGVFSLRGGGSYSIKKSHRMNISLAMVSNKTKGNEQPDTFEFNAGLGYTYLFGNE